MGVKYEQALQARCIVLLFAQAAEIAGRRDIELVLSAGSTVAAALHHLRDLHPALGALLDRAAVAVNEQYARLDQPVSDGDRIAIIPPVSGG